MVVCTEINNEVKRLYALVERVNNNILFADFEIQQAVDFQERLKETFKGRYVPDLAERCYINFEALRNALGPFIMEKYLKDAKH